MNPSKAVELMQIYLAEHRREMAPDDVTAHAQAIGALMVIESVAKNGALPAFLMCLWAQGALKICS